MDALAIILILLSAAIVITQLVCYVMVVVEMFRRGDQTMGIICAVGFFVCGIGLLVAFVYGWMKSQEWGLKNVMLVWTGCIIANFVLQGIGAAVGASFTALQGG